MTRLIGVLAVVGVLAVAGCGSSSSNSSGSGAAGTSTPSPTSTASSSSSGGGATVALAADPSGALKFDQKTLSAKAGTVTIDFTNMSSVPHAVAVEGNGVDKAGQVVSGGKNTLSVDLKPGTYTFYCPVDGHRAAGMEGKLTVK